MKPWTSTDPRWQALSPFQRAAAMALMEADRMDPDSARNVLGAMINRANAEKVQLGEHVSQPIYQPTIEPSQQSRLDRILQNPAFPQLTSWAERRAAGQESDPVGGATHFLAPEKTMLALTAREPQKYRSWPKWTGYDASTGEYKNVVMRDNSHAFLTPNGEHVAEPRGGSMNGGYGMSPVGAAGIAGPIHTAEPAPINSQFADLKLPAQPMMALGGPAAGSNGFGGLDFNDPQLGQAIMGLANKFDMETPRPPQVQMARAQAPRVNFATVAQILANRRKPGNRGEGGRGI